MVHESIISEINYLNSIEEYSPSHSWDYCHWIISQCTVYDEEIMVKYLDEKKGGFYHHYRLSRFGV